MPEFLTPKAKTRSLKEIMDDPGRWERFHQWVKLGVQDSIGMIIGPDRRRSGENVHIVRYFIQNQEEEFHSFAVDVLHRYDSCRRNFNILYDISTQIRWGSWAICNRYWHHRPDLLHELLYQGRTPVESAAQRRAKPDPESGEAPDEHDVFTDPQVVEILDEDSRRQADEVHFNVSLTNFISSRIHNREESDVCTEIIMFYLNFLALNVTVEMTLEDALKDQPADELFEQFHAASDHVDEYNFSKYYELIKHLNGVMGEFRSMLKDEKDGSAKS